MPPPHNIAQRMGRWSAQHRKTAIGGWFLFVILAVFIGGSVGTNTLTDQEAGVGESGRADKAVYDGFPKKANESVFIQNKNAVATDPQYRDTVGAVMAKLRATKGVQNIEGPYASTNNISPDKHSVLIDYELPGDADATKKSVDAPMAAIKQEAASHPGYRIEPFGDASTQKDFDQAIQDDLRKAEVISVPLTLIILAIAFGTLVAAGVPVLLAITAVAATLGLLGPISHISPVSENISSVVLLVGLAVGVDYCLFYIRREREERASCTGAAEALDRAASTSGRAVMISGLTVIVAMSGMYLAGAADFSSFATGTIVVVALAIIGSLTVLPALLAKLGDRIDKGRIPGLARVKARMASWGLWGRVVDRVMKRPVVAIVLAGGLLVALAIPAFDLHTAQSDNDSLPQDLPVVQTFNRVEAAFPSEISSAQVVVQSEDVTSGPAALALGELKRATAKRPDLYKGKPEVDVNPDKTLSTVTIPTAGGGYDKESERALTDLRDNIMPATYGKAPGVQSDVTGSAAVTKDFNDSLRSHAPYVFAFVLGAAFVLLLLTFRSIVIPIKAIALNLLSVGAAYGVLVLVFQHGWGESVLGFHDSSAIVPWLPLFLFVILFGLSMDYHVFILTRVREAYDRGMSTEDAVSHAIKTTAGVVTSAAIVMVAVFSIFATLSLLDFKQLGVGLAAAVLIDATVIRAVLLPATMKLLGDWNWYLPSWLEWLPHVSGEEAAEPISRPVPPPITPRPV